MPSSCKNCPERDRCKVICPEIERLLPPADGSTRAELSIEGKLIAWKIQDIEDELPPRQREAASRYFRLGESQEEIALKIGVSQHTVSVHLAAVRRKILRKIRRNTV